MVFKKLIVAILIVSSVSTLIAQDNLWKPLLTGAGGWITGFDIHQSGSPIYMRSDVGGAYRYVEATDSWIQIVTAETMPSPEIDITRYSGVLSIVSAPNAANIVYMAFQDGIFKSENQGDNWVRTNFPSIDNEANGELSRLSGERLAVDPNNADVVYFGSIEDGLWVTFDGGDTWTSVNTVPTGLPERGIREVKFDIASGTTAGRTNTVYASIDGEDVYVSTDAGNTWNATNTGLTTPIFLDTEITPSGKLYVVGNQSGTQSFGAMEYDGVSWRTVFSQNTTEFLNLAIDPFNEDRALLFANGITDTYQTGDLSSASPQWEFKTRTRVAPNIPWMAWSNNEFFSIGEIQFDPAVADKLWISDGVGTWVSTDLDDSDVTWIETSRDQEHLVSNDIIGLPDGTVVTAHWDVPIFKHKDLDSYPETHGPINRFNSSWSLDRNLTTPNFVAAVVDDHRFCCFDDETSYSGYSEDGGITWTKFESLPEGDTQLFGFISVSATDTDNIVWLPAENRLPYYTLDRGVTWNQASIPGSSDDCCLSAFFFSRLALVADRTLANTFYLYDFGNGFIHKSSDGGANWETLTGLDNAFAFNAKLESVPNNPEHLFFVNGIEQATDLIEPLRHSIDGGTTWTFIENTDKVLNVAIGATESGANYPTVFIQGEVNDVFGIFKSTDEGVSWQQIGTYPLGIYDVAKVFEANPFIPGVLYMGFAGNGFVYYEDPSVLNVVDLDKQLFSLQPNPVTDGFEISGLVSPESSYQLYDITGKIVRSGNVSKNDPYVSMQEYPAGLYLIKIVSGAVTQTLKVVKN